jgi:hypothetical protein
MKVYNIPKKVYLPKNNIIKIDGYLIDQVGNCLKSKLVTTCDSIDHLIVYLEGDERDDEEILHLLMAIGHGSNEMVIQALAWGVPIKSWVWI